MKEPLWDHHGLLSRLRRTWTLTELLEVAAAEALSLLGADRVCLYLWDGSGERLFPAHAASGRVDVLASVAALEVNPDLIPGVREALFEECRPVAVSSAESHPWLSSDRVRLLGIQSFWAAPLWDGVGPTTFGALAAHQTAALRVLGEADLAGIEAVARSITLAFMGRMPTPRPRAHRGAGRSAA